MAEKIDKTDTNIFYVYQWYNSSSGEVFYVGKGKNNRFKTIKGRNEYFLNYYKKHIGHCDFRKVKENLSEKDAFSIERDMIAHFRKINMVKCNITDGGEGAYGINHRFTKKFGDILDIDKNTIKITTESELRKIIEDIEWSADGMNTFDFLLGEEGWDCLDD